MTTAAVEINAGAGVPCLFKPRAPPDSLLVDLVFATASVSAVMTTQFDNDSRNTN